MSQTRISVLGLLVAVNLAWSCNALGQRPNDGEDSVETAVARAQYEQNIQGYLAGIENGQAGPEQRGQLIRAYQIVGKYKEAEEQARIALNESDSSRAALSSLGDLLILKGRYDEAELLLKKAVSLPQAESISHLRLGRLLLETGRKSEARSEFESVMRLYQGGSRNSQVNTLAAAQAAKYLSRFRDANRLYQEATSLPGDHLDAYVAWGKLFLAKYNRKDATLTFEDALKIDPTYPPALAGLADALSETRTSVAEANARQALEINPALTEARHLLARLYLDDEQYEAAIEQLMSALEVNPKSAETRSLLAACYHAMGRQDDFDAQVALVLNVNPFYGQLYSTVADNLSRRYRFEEAIEMGRAAIKLDPELWSAYSGLGVNLSRVGREQEARVFLDQAFEGDSYNVWTLNTLNLFDSIDKYTTHRSDHFILKLDSDEDPVYGKLALELLEEAHRTISPRYGFEPERPILVELFPQHNDFAVRISGLPGAGALLGVCFGEVVVADSPKARPVGSFNWGQTLWHEFAHVIHLQMTRNRIPRWLAEGIAVYEARIARPEWDIDLSLEFAHAAERGDLLKISDLNSGFTRPKSAEQVILSYYQASIAVEFIVEKYGFEAIRSMLTNYERDKPTDQIIEDTFNISFDDFDEAFAEYADEITKDTREAIRFSAATGKQLSEADLRAEIAANPGSFYAHLYLGRVLMADGQEFEAVQMLRKARALLPKYIHPGNPYELLSEIHRKNGELDEQVVEMEALLAIDEDDIETCKSLAAIYESNGQNIELIEVLSKATMINPFDSAVRNMRGRAYERIEQYDSAITEFTAALKIETTDLAAAHYNLARVYLAAGRRSDAKNSALSALKIAPNFGEAQEILLDAMER